MHNTSLHLEGSAHYKQHETEVQELFVFCLLNTKCLYYQDDLYPKIREIE